MLLLVQESIFICNKDEKTESRKKEVMVMQSSKNEEDADGGETEIYSLNLHIDRYSGFIPDWGKQSPSLSMDCREMPPTGFPHCDLVDMGYFVHAVAKTNKLYDDVVVKLPIIILHGDKDDWENENENFADSFRH